MKIPYLELGIESLKRLDESASNAYQVQEDLLSSLLKSNKDTIFGKKYRFAEIDSILKYQQMVPITTYANYDEYIKQMLNGAENVLTATPPIYYSISAGSTGEPKYLPVSEDDMYVHYWYAYCAIFGMVHQYYSDCLPEQIFGKIFQTGDFFKTYGNNKIMNGIRSSSIYQWMDINDDFDASDYCVPKEVLFPTEIEDLIYVKARFALAEAEITAIHGVFIHRVVGVLSYIAANWELLLRDMENGTVDENISLKKTWREKMMKWLPPNPDRAKELRKLDYNTLKDKMILKIWRNAKYILAIGGSGFSYNMEKLHIYAGGLPVHYFAYAASEGIFGVAKGLNCPDQYILLPESGLFEFAPVEASEAPLLGMQDIKLGEKYSIIFTNHSGLYRYELMDVVEIVGFYRQAPVVRFCYRKNQVVSIADEWTNMEHFEKAMRYFEISMGMEINGYGVQEDYSVQPGRYLIYIEGIKLDNFRVDKDVDQIMDECLQKGNLGYAGCRTMNEVSLAKVAFLPQGSFKRYEDHLTKLGHQMGQNKPLRILDSFEKREFFAKEHRIESNKLGEIF